MNLLEHYIIEIHSEQELLAVGMVKVDLTYDCYGTIRRGVKLFGKREWEEAKKEGVFLA